MKDKNRRKTEYRHGDLLRGLRTLLRQQVRPFLAYTLIFVVTGSMLLSAAERTGAAEAFFSEVIYGTEGDDAALSGDERVNAILERYGRGELDGEEARRLLAVEGVSISNAPISFEDEEELTAEELTELEDAAELALTEKRLKETESSFLLVRIEGEDVLPRRASESELRSREEKASPSNIDGEKEIASSSELPAETGSREESGITPRSVSGHAEAASSEWEEMDLLSELGDELSFPEDFITSLIAVRGAGADGAEQKPENLKDYLGKDDIRFERKGPSDAAWKPVTPENPIRHWDSIALSMKWRIPAEKLREKTSYIYQLPGAVGIEQEIAGEITRRLPDGTEQKIGKYTISQDGTVRLDYTSADFLGEQGDVLSEFWIKARANLDKADENGEIVFDTKEGKIRITNIAASYDMYIDKKGEKTGERELRYRITVGTSRGTEPGKPISLTDTIKSQPEGAYRFQMKPGSFLVEKLDAQGNKTAVSLPGEALQLTADGSFRLSGLEPLGKGERYEISYQVLVDGDLAKYTEKEDTAAVNRASAGWDGGGKRESETRTPITTKKTVSQKGRKSGEYDNKNKLIHWKVVVNPDASRDVSGWTFRDAPALLPYKGESYNRIVPGSVRLYKDGNEWWSDPAREIKLAETGTYSYDAEKNEIRYTFPTGRELKSSYLFEYDTTAPPLQPGEHFTADNSAEVDHEQHSASVSGDEAPGRWNVEKQALGYEKPETGTGGKYIFPKWSAAVTELPKTEVKELLFEDTIKEAWSQGHSPEEQAHFGNAAVLSEQLRKNLTLTLRDSSGTRVRLLSGTDPLAAEYHVEIKFYDAEGREITDLQNRDIAAAERVKRFTIRIGRKDGKSLAASRLELGEYSTVQDISVGGTGESWEVKNTAIAGGTESTAHNRYFVSDGGLRKEVKRTWENNFSSGEESYSFESLGAEKLLNYRLTLSTTAADEGRDIVLRDSLPEGMTLVEDSVKAYFLSTVDGKYSTLSDAGINLNDADTFMVNTAEDGRSFTIRIRNYKLDPEKPIIHIYYNVNLLRGWKEAKETKVFRNTVEWTSRGGMGPVHQETTVTRDYPKIRKEGVQLREIVDGKEQYRAQLDYKLLINAKGEKLGTQDTITLVDEITQAVRWGQSSLARIDPKLIPGSVKLFRYDGSREDGVGEEIQDARFRYTYQEDAESGKRILQVTLPNSIACVLKYSYETSRSLTNDDEISNKATLSGGYSSESRINLKEISSGASANKDVIRLQKVDSQNFRQQLSGAVFRLESYDASAQAFTSADVLDADGFTVDKEKIWDLSREKSLKRDVLYRLEETKAPEGYRIGEKYHYFIVKGDEEDSAAWEKATGGIDSEALREVQAKLRYLKGGEVYTVENEAMLTVEKQWLKKDGSTLEKTPDSVSFKLYQRKNAANHTVFIESTGSSLTSSDQYAFQRKNYAPIVVSDGASLSLRAVLSWGINFEVAMKDGEKADISIDGEPKQRVKLQYDKQGRKPDGFTVQLQEIHSDIHLTVRHLGSGDPPAGDWNAAELGDIKVTDGEGPAPPKLIGTYTIYRNPAKNNTGKAWSMVFDQLEASDKDGNPYFYSVEELDVPEGFLTTYSQGAVQSGLIVITNQATEDTVYTLPETGGIGTKRLYFLGSMWILLAGAALCYKKKQEGKEKGKRDERI